MTSIATLRVDISAINNIDDIQAFVDRTTQWGGVALIVELEAEDDWTLRGLVDEVVDDIESHCPALAIDREAIEHRVVK